jgi:Fic family protein
VNRLAYAAISETIFSAEDAVILRYIYEQAAWPTFRWNAAALNGQLGALRHRQGRLVGRMESLGFTLRAEAALQTLTEDVVKSSEIEGEVLDRTQVRSSIARRLGIDIGALAPIDRDVEGVVQMMLDATQHYDRPLDAERLFAWHAALFPTGRSGMSRIRIGQWGDDAAGPMQVVSGPIGHERVHYQRRPTRSMAKCGHSSPGSTPSSRSTRLLRAAIADMSLARSEQSPQRFYSMSAQIRIGRKAYYDLLEATQKGDLDITAWLSWFLACLDGAFAAAETVLNAVLSKHRFWETHTAAAFNVRQKHLLAMLLDGFDGKLTTSKWAKIAKCSQDTALRDIDDLVAKAILKKDDAGGRSTSYSLLGGHF